MIEDWVVEIDQRLRDTAKARMPSYGNQKNFQSPMQGLKEEHPDGFVPDETWFRAFVAKTIIFRTVQAIVKAKNFPAYQANITALESTIMTKCNL